MRTRANPAGLAAAAVILLLGGIGAPAGAAYLRDVPQSLTQPNGTLISCFASGDQFYHWLYDTNGYVIIQDPANGYYTYAVERDGDVVPSAYVVGRVDPVRLGLKKNIMPSPEVLRLKRERYALPAGMMSAPPPPAGGTINNICVFIKFSGDSEFTDPVSFYNNMFNSASPGVSSMHNYFSEASYNSLTVSTTFYPTTFKTTVSSYQDSHTRNYFRRYSASNPVGYRTDDEGRSREFALLKSAVAAISSQVPASLNIDRDNDGKVDNVCFVIKGGPEAWGDVLWPRHWQLFSVTANINGKRVWNYNLQLQNSLASSGAGVLCHEMFHSMGAPDLYHYSQDGISPAYQWDLMDNDRNPPQHMSAYMKCRYGGWISSIPEITAPGVYSLNPLTSPTGACFKIKSPKSASEYYVLEYRKQTGTFEGSLPGSGLLVWRINTARDGKGNTDGPPDELYLYRPGGSTAANGSPAGANLCADAGRTEIGDSAELNAFLSNGLPGGLQISNIGPIGNTIAFTVGAPSGNLRICKFDDRNLNGVFDAAEELADWPFRVEGPGVVQDVVTGPDGCVTIEKLPEAEYTVTELIPTPDADGNFEYGPDKWWHAFTPPVQKVFVPSGQTADISFRNVCLVKVTALVFHDINMDGQYDQPECPIPNWPFVLTGKRTDGTPISVTGKTDENGMVTFANLMPSDGAGYTLREDLTWDQVALGSETVMRASHAARSACGGPEACEIDRWQATTAVENAFITNCANPTASFAFGNVGLARVEGVVEVYDKGMPGESAPSANASGWQVCLAGVDSHGREVAPSDSAHGPLPEALQAPGGVPCLTPKWYEIVTGADGKFVFTDLPPGRYYLAQAADCNYRQSVDRPVQCGFDVVCCPESVKFINIGKTVATTLYQVYPGNSNERVGHFIGRNGKVGEAITAVPGVLQIVPGNDWANFTSITSGEAELKSVVLTKEFQPFMQCPEVFTRTLLTQKGPDAVRLWWPLMYEPPRTTWTLQLTYTTAEPVQLPGECSSGTMHREECRWVVETDIEHMKLYLDLLYELPCGLAETPLITSPALYADLKSMLDAMDEAVNEDDMVTALARLLDFENLVIDNTITSPPRGAPWEGGLGIIQTAENPAACKLLVDAEYVGLKLGIFTPGK